MAHDKCSGKILLRCATIKKKWRMAKVTILYSTMYKVQYSPLIACTIVQYLIRVERFCRKKMGRHGDVAAHWERFQKQKDSNSLRFESGISHTERKNQSEQAGPQCDALKSL